MKVKNNNWSERFIAFMNEWDYGENYAYNKKQIVNVRERRVNITVYPT